jgi:hypothetical protein
MVSHASFILLMYNEVCYKSNIIIYSLTYMKLYCTINNNL